MSTAPIRTWRHSRKGIIRGRVISDSGTFLTIELDRDHHLSYNSNEMRGQVDQEGERIQVRTSLLTEVDSDR